MSTAAEQRRRNGGMTDAEIDAHAYEMEAFADDLHDELTAYRDAGGVVTGWTVVSASAWLDGFEKETAERRDLAARISTVDNSIRVLRSARAEVYATCDRVDVDAGPFGHSPFAGRDLVDCPEVSGDDYR